MTRPRAAIRAAMGAMAVLLAVAVAGCGDDDAGNSGGASSEPYKFGLLTTSAGPFASNAKVMQQGAEYAVKLINDAGGIDGAKIELITTDLLNDPQNAATTVPELASKDNVVAVIGPVDSAGCEIACALANKLKMPIVSPGAARPGVLNGARPYGFSVAQPDAANSTGVLKKIITNQQVKTAAIIYDAANATTKAQFDLFKNVFESSGVQIVKTATFTSGDASFAAQITSIAGSRPDVLALAAGPDDAGRIAVEVKAQNLTTKLLGTGSLQSGGAAYIKAAGAAAEGTLAAAQYDPKSTAAPAKDLLEKAQQATGLAEIPLNFAYAHDAVNMIVDIIKSKKLSGDSDSVVKTREAIKDGLTSSGGYNGMAGTTKFGEDGFSLRPELISRVENGRFVIVRDGS
jgi:branched-chain amino acid transport system substrate-binding protein